MNYKVFLFAFCVGVVFCEESSEEDTRIYNNGQPLTVPQLLQVSNFNGGYSPTTQSPLLQYNPTTATPIYVQNQQGSTYNPTTSSPFYIQTHQPTTASPLYIQSQQPTGSYSPSTASPLYIQQTQGQQPVQVIQIPNQTQKPNNIYVQTQQPNQQQPVQVIQVPTQTQKPNNIYVQTQQPNKKPSRPSRPNKRPTTQPPIFISTQPQNTHSQNPVQVIQVSGQPTTASPPIVIQTQPQHQNHHQIVTIPQEQNKHPIQVVNQLEPQQEIYQIYPGQLDNPTDYEFNWFVNNQENGDYKSHREVRQNDIVQGQYEVLDPDGYRRIVTYTADELHGFRAIVRRIPLNSAAQYVTTQRPFYFGSSTTQRPFGARGKKHASVAPLENSSLESGSANDETEK